MKSLKHITHGIVNLRSTISRFRVKTRHIVIALLVLIVALIQTHTIWDFFGERADENGLFHYAIGFFGGDFNPIWTGYGNLGMYIIYLVYMTLSLPFLLIGKFDSLEEYAMQMFYNGYFVLVARYTFAVLGVITVFIYAKAARLVKVPMVLIILFIIISISSTDAICFANYLRSEMLVGLFVGLSILFAIKSDKKIYLYLLAIMVAGAISSKISA